MSYTTRFRVPSTTSTAVGNYPDLVSRFHLILHPGRNTMDFDLPPPHEPEPSPPPPLTAISLAPPTALLGMEHATIDALVVAIQKPHLTPPEIDPILWIQDPAAARSRGRLTWARDVRQQQAFERSTQRKPSRFERIEGRGRRGSRGGWGSRGGREPRGRRGLRGERGPKGARWSSCR